MTEKKGVFTLEGLVLHSQITEKKVVLTLEGLDGNAFFLLGAFRNAAKRQGWTKEEIDAVCNEAKSGDYDHLVATLSDACEEPEDE